QGTDLQIDVTLHTGERIEAPAIGIVLRTGYGDRVSGFSTVNHRGRLDPVEPGKFSFSATVPLFVPAGMYRVELVLADVSGEQPRLLRIWEELVLVNVQWADYSIPGVIDSGTEIQFRGERYSMRLERDRRQQDKSRR